MGSLVKKVSAIAIGGLILVGLARRGRAGSGGPPWWNPPGSGVREPRRPLQPTGSAAAAADPADPADP